VGGIPPSASWLIFKARTTSIAVFLILQPCLGIQIDAVAPAIRLTHSVLPESVPYVRISGLRVGSAEVSLEITRRNKTVRTAILDRRGDIDILVIK
jgi:hypothetical protein